MLLSKFRYMFVALMVAGLIFCVSKASYAGDYLPTDPSTVIVQVTGMGSPIEGAEVSVGDSSGTTNIAGNYVFQVGKGTYTVSVTDPHENTDSREYLVGPGEIVQITFELGAAGRPATVHH
ncbi:MAG: carboxypeptidase-like regulatory domain-containing protein [Candidatus Scalindua sp.]